MEFLWMTEWVNEEERVGNEKTAITIALVKEKMSALKWRMCMSRAQSSRSMLLHHNDFLRMFIIHDDGPTQPNHGLTQPNYGLTQPYHGRKSKLSISLGSIPMRQRNMYHQILDLRWHQWLRWQQRRKKLHRKNGRDCMGVGLGCIGYSKKSVFWYF